MVLARAEELKGQADMTQAQNKQGEIQGTQQLKMMELQLRDKELNLRQQEFDRAGQAKFNTELISADQNQQKINQEQEKIDNNTALQQMQLLMKQQESMTAEIKTNAESFKIMAEAMQTFVGPGIVQAGIKQADIIQESQEDVGINDIEE